MALVVNANHVILFLRQGLKDMERNSVEQNLQLAEALLADEKPHQAEQILLETLQVSNYERKLSQDILFLLIQTEMYDEALTLIEDYKKQVGEDLPSDFSVEDITIWRDDKRKKESA